jgi:hypothetical protein
MGDYQRTRRVEGGKSAVVILAVLLAGCAVQGPDYENTPASPAKSAIYLYRPYHSFAGGASPVVNCGDGAVGLGPGGFHRFTLDPGPVHCSVHTEVTTSIDVDAKAGQTYYIRESLWIGFIVPHVHLDPENPEEASAEIQECKEQ